jgi:hypothetical protein
MTILNDNTTTKRKGYGIKRLQDNFNLYGSMLKHIRIQ